MNILGFMGWASHNPAACIIKTEKNGNFKFSTIAEERLNRVKYSYHFPLRSIKYCLSALGISSLDDIDLVVNDWSQNMNSFASNRSFRRLEFDYIRKKLKIDKTKIKLIPSHHLAHAYSTFIPSGFDEAAILVVDAIGSKLHGTSIYHGKGTKIRLIENSGTFSMGKLYDVITREVLNFGIGEDGKTMGLAAFGEKHAGQPPVLNIQGRYDKTMIDYSAFMQRIPDNSIINGKITRCTDKKELYKPYFSKAALEVQEEVEKGMLHLARYAKKKTGCRNLCIAGGVGLNCVANEKIRTSGLFENVFILPASSDAGVPFGLALWGYYNYYKKPFFKPVLTNAFIGRDYRDENIKKVLRKFDIPYRKTNPNEVAGLIADKNVIAWHTGGSEFGPRALGHRSILADPRDHRIKDILNSRVKHREMYRPFAPSVMAEYASEYFELKGNASPFMLQAPKVKRDKVAVIPAVVHVDGTGRVQTVAKKDCPKYYDLIRAFHRITGVPVILNTSFNDNKEAIVETPIDSLICFLRTKIDYLIFNGNLLISKKEIKDKDALAGKINRRNENRLRSEYKKLLKEFLTSYSIKELREFLILSQRLANHYKRYDSYERLFDFLLKNRNINFIGDKYHLGLLKSIKNEIFREVIFKSCVLLDDRLKNIEKVNQKIKFIRNKFPILMGFYNLSELLRENPVKNKKIFLLYKNYQVHLANVVGKDGPGGVALEGIETFSREYNMSKDFDGMFEPYIKEKK